MSNPPPPELTPRAIILAIILAMILAGANAYLGLFAGMTIASAIPFATAPPLPPTLPASARPAKEAIIPVTVPVIPRRGAAVPMVVRTSRRLFTMLIACAL